MRHITLFVMMAISTLACDKLQKKDNRSEGEAAVIEETASSSGDATVSESDAATKETTVDKTAAALGGKELYAKLCASCHQALDNTDVPKAPLAKIQDAIQKEADMAGLKATADKDLAAIAEALKTVSKGQGKGEDEQAD